MPATDRTGEAETPVTTVHVALPGRRAEQLRSFYAQLDRKESGRLTHASYERWYGLLRMEGITPQRATQIMNGNDEKRAALRGFNPETARKYIEYLTRHGYTVTPPKSPTVAAPHPEGPRS